jgi:prepilin-type N-terminal cleavage/methylation domain-containing protein
MVTRGLDRARRWLTEAGFSLTELIVVVGVIGIIMAASAPFFLSYLRTSALRTGAEEMVTVLNRARQLAIRDNSNMCVTNDGTRVQYHIATCGGTVWTGPGTDVVGFIRLGNNITVASGQNVVFTYIGTATVAGTYTVTNPQDSRTMSVIVAPSGRVSIGP